MLAINESSTLEDAGADLLGFILRPENWVVLSELKATPWRRPGQNPDYQRQVGTLHVCASVDVAPSLQAFLRIAFKAPGLTPQRASDHLHAFVSRRLPLTPNTEWQVMVDERNWVHFIRRWTQDALSA
jgi:hypothetical protein